MSINTVKMIFDGGARGQFFMCQDASIWKLRVENFEEECDALKGRLILEKVESLSDAPEEKRNG